MVKGSWREFNSPVPAGTKRNVQFSNKSQLNVRVQRMKGGKGGKTVTVISGLNLLDIEAKNLLKRLKIKCGTGGTMKEDFLELQGDKLEVVIEFLSMQGYRPKRSGG